MAVCNEHPGEEWRDVPGYEGYYQVSNRGRVKRLPIKITRNDGVVRYFRERIRVTPPINKLGHRGVSLCKGGLETFFLVHHLVLMAFDRPRPNGLQCRHFPDRNPAHNCIENLQWGTASEDRLDRVYHGTCVDIKGTRGEENATSILTEKQVRKIRKLYSRIPKIGNRKQLGSLKQLADRFGVSVYAIQDVVYRRSWGHVK